MSSPSAAGDSPKEENKIQTNVEKRTPERERERERREPTACDDFPVHDAEREDVYFVVVRGIVHLWCSPPAAWIRSATTSERKVDRKI
jgi:hypothetical protein